MEVLTTTTATNTNTTRLITISKPSEPESENPTQIHQQQPINTTTTSNITKPLSFSNGVLKRHHPNTHNNNNVVAVTYKECLKNHMATLGGHALDGFCEFMQSPTATSEDPASIKCAACGCHRNFHCREPEEPISTVLEYQPLPPFLHPPALLQIEQHLLPSNDFPPSSLSHSKRPCRKHSLPTELKKAIMQARTDKKLTQAQLAQIINEKPQVIQEYESGKAIPNQQIIGKLERALGAKLRGKK
ncbi:hypothetical protein RYX36_028784 [Vicia faba]